MKYIFATCFSLYKQLSCQNMYYTASCDQADREYDFIRCVKETNDLIGMIVER